MSSNIGASAAQSPPRGLRKRLIAFITVMLMALGFGGLSALPALASSPDEDGGSEAGSSAESLEEEDEAAEEDEDDDAVEEDDAAAQEEQEADPAEEAEEPEAVSEEEQQEEAAEEPAEAVTEEVFEAETVTLETTAEEPVPEEQEVVDEDSSAEQAVSDEDEAAELALMAAVAEEEDEDDDDEELLETFQEENSIEVTLSDEEISEADAQRSGITVSIEGLEFEDEVEVLLNGETVATGLSISWGFASYVHTDGLSVGEHTFTVVVNGGESYDASVTVTEGGYEPEVYLSLDVQDGEPVVSEWDVAREGFSVTGNDFEPGSAVTATIGGTQVGAGTADDYGTVEIEGIAAELSVGTYTLTLSSEKATGSVDFTVLSDDSYFDLDEDEIAGFEAVASVRVATESELAAGELTTRTYNFPYQQALDLYINDELAASGISGADEYVITGLAPGSYTATWVFGEHSASVDFAVVPDEQGAPAPQGSYGGTAQIGQESSVELTFEIDENGVLTGFSSPRIFQCVGYQGIPTDPFEFDWNVPATPITVDQPFEIRWEDYVVSGIVNSDGSASGEAEWRIPCWGAIHDHWTAQADVATPDPEPTPDPTDEPTDPAPTEDPEPTPEPTTDPEPTDEPTTAPTEDPTDGPTEGPTSEPTVDPTPDPTDDPDGSGGQDGISAPSSAVAGSQITVTVGEPYAGEQVSVWLYSEPVLLGTPTVSQVGTVTVTLPEDVTGDHTLEVTGADGETIGTAPITITAASEDTGDDDGADGGSGDSTGDEGTDDDTGSSDGPGDGGQADPAGSTDEDDTTDGDDSATGSTEDAATGDADADDTEAESADGGLAATGTTAAALIALGAGLLMLLGAGVLSISRRRTHHTME